MKSGSVRLTRGHSSGHVKIKDRKNKLDAKGKAVEGDYEEVIHRLGLGSFDVSVKPKFEKDGVTPMKDSHGREKKEKLIVGKAFTVNDIDYVLKNHGSIL